MPKVKDSKPRRGVVHCREKLCTVRRKRREEIRKERTGKIGGRGRRHCIQDTFWAPEKAW